MSTKLTQYVKAGGLAPVDKAEMAKALLQAGNEEATGTANDGVEYVSFSGKTGALTFGRDQQQLPSDEAFLIEPASAFRGWICWKESKPVARHQWSIYSPQLAIAERDLEDKGPFTRKQDGWKSVMGFGFISTDGEAVQYSFSSNSTSGKNAISDLFKEIAARMARGEPHYPIFYFTKEKFFAQGEWNWKPKFEIEEWIDEAEAAAMLGGEEAEAEPEQIAEPEPEPEEVKPARTRRARRA